MNTPEFCEVEDAEGEFVHLSAPKLPGSVKQPIIIAVMGVTGSGKSSFIQVATGRDDVVVGHELEACTSDVRSFPAVIDGVAMNLADTPGFNGTYKSDTQILVKHSEWLELTYRKGIKLTAIIIIYLHRINILRMEGSSLLDLQMFRKLCGTDALKHVLLVTTHWKSVKQSEGERLEKQLIDKFWGELVERGAEYCRYDGTENGALELVRKPAQRGQVQMAIQREMVDLNLPLSKTGAGMAVSEELAEMKRTHQLELRALQEEMLTARRKNDQRAQEQMRQDRLKLLLLARSASRERGNEMRQLELAWRAKLEDVVAASNKKIWKIWRR